jgi:hypothetical protein
MSSTCALAITRETKIHTHTKKKVPFYQSLLFRNIKKELQGLLKSLEYTVKKPKELKSYSANTEPP